MAKRFEIKINVTKEDIANGIPNNSLECPISRAVKKQYPKALLVKTDPYWIRVVIPRRKFLWWYISKERNLFIDLPRKAKTFITNFDAYNDTILSNPFSFTAKGFEI